MNRAMHHSPQQRQPSLQFTAGSSDALPALSVAPLVDIVLLLICFYLLVSRAMQAYDDPAVLLPQMSAQTTEQQGPAAVVINLREDGSLTANGQAMALAELGTWLEARPARTRAPGATMTVTIRADGRLRHHQLQEVLGTIREARLPTVVLRVDEREGS